ncbi:PepSY domain-containing protein [Dyadobacter sp. CY351]|uniref:PepSY-associated TM helix domain-containing protein n=1 Tax=Dyadobacter sp. CY351 TaxID=2909337 RepID=UPI001F2B2357|nr:PepSY-associated TM helix domain-containing protein [Dyadobacter sp. CY351]MCF2517695.1 PepSY domain-containing protein [Dyadobacter sp. CY351]
MLKKINAWLHLWLGLASGIVVFIVSITGCVLVFEQELKSLTRPWSHAKRVNNEPYLPPSQIAGRLKTSLPGRETHSIWYYGHEQAAKVTIDADSMVFVNPYTAEVQAIVAGDDFFHFILDGHVGVWIEGEVGHQIVAWATLIFFILLVTGLILWWPKKWTKSEKKKAFSIKWKAKFRRVNYDLHNVLGFYSLILAMILTLTGLIMGFAWINDGVYWLASGGSEPAKRISSFSDTTQIITPDSIPAVDRAFRKGLEEIAVYNKDAIIVGFPDEPKDAIYICTDMDRGAWRDVYLDQYTLAALPSSAVQVDNLKFADWLRRNNYGLHVGAIGNMPTKIIYFIASLVCASLPVTGFFVWWGKRKKTKRVKRLIPLHYDS